MTNHHFGGPSAFHRFGVRVLKRDAPHLEGCAVVADACHKAQVLVDCVCVCVCRFNGPSLCSLNQTTEAADGLSCKSCFVSLMCPSSPIHMLKPSFSRSE